MELSEITAAARAAALEIIERSKISAGDILIVGCSTSEVVGFAPGTHSGPELGKAIMEGILPECLNRGIYLAAQCCEHLNRAVILEKAAADKYGADIRTFMLTLKSECVRIIKSQDNKLSPLIGRKEKNA